MTRLSDELGCSSNGRAPGCYPEGWWFDSTRPSSLLGVVVELVDTLDSKSGAFTGVGVRFPPTLPYRDVAQSGSASALGAEGHRFKSCHPDHNGGVAQMGEHRLCKPRVRGSIPLTSTNFGAVAQLVRAASLYLVLASDKRKVVGSSPTSPTTPLT